MRFPIWTQINLNMLGMRGLVFALQLESGVCKERWQVHIQYTEKRWRILKNYMLLQIKASNGPASTTLFLLVQFCTPCCSTMNNGMAKMTIMALAQMLPLHHVGADVMDQRVEEILLWTMCRWKALRSNLVRHNIYCFRWNLVKWWIIFSCRCRDHS